MIGREFQTPTNNKNKNENACSSLSALYSRLSCFLCTAGIYAKPHTPTLPLLSPPSPSIFITHYPAITPPLPSLPPSPLFGCYPFPLMARDALSLYICVCLSICLTCVCVLSVFMYVLRGWPVTSDVVEGKRQHYKFVVSAAWEC